MPRLAVVKEMIRRLQELRHTDQVQRAYALNCGEGATVSYELQIRVLREFGLPDGAAELLQVTQHILFAWRLTSVAMATVDLSLTFMSVTITPDLDEYNLFSSDCRHLY